MRQRGSVPLGPRHRVALLRFGRISDISSGQRRWPWRLFRPGQIVVCFLHHYARVAASPLAILSGGRLAEHESGGAYRRCWREFAERAPAVKLADFIGLGAVMPVATLEARRPVTACPKRAGGAIVKPILPRYHSEDYHLRDPGEVSDGAAERCIPDVTTAFNAAVLQFCPSPSAPAIADFPR